MRGDRKAKKVTSDQGPLSPIREKFMKYIAEILSDDIVWLINKKTPDLDTPDTERGGLLLPETLQHGASGNRPPARCNESKLLVRPYAYQQCATASRR
jgi:hypothetical protein